MIHIDSLEIKKQTFTGVDNPGEYSAFHSNLNAWLTFFSFTKTWQPSAKSDDDLSGVVNLLKFYFVYFPERFEWSKKSNNRVSIKLLDSETYKNVDIEFFDDSKFFKTIFLWIPYKGPEYTVEFGHKYWFSNYGSTVIDNDFPTDYYNTKSIDTTSKRKYSVYDVFFNTTTEVPKRFKLTLTSSAGILPMWTQDDSQNFYVLKSNGTATDISSCYWDSEKNELTVDNAEGMIARGDRFFVSVSYPENIIANNISLKCESLD